VSIIAKKQPLPVWTGSHKSSNNHFAINFRFGNYYFRVYAATCGDLRHPGMNFRLVPDYFLIYMMTSGLVETIPPVDIDMYRRLCSTLSLPFPHLSAQTYTHMHTFNRTSNAYTHMHTFNRASNPSHIHTQFSTI
jgi:hypothetical protein